MTETRSRGMSERAKQLRTRIIGAIAVHGGSRTLDVGVARAICEHLGIDWEEVDQIAYAASGYLSGDFLGKSGHAPGMRLKRTSDALATLLEAAGIER